MFISGKVTTVLSNEKPKSFHTFAARTANAVFGKLGNCIICMLSKVNVYRIPVLL